MVSQGRTKKRNVGHQSAIEKDDANKNKLKITVGTSLHKGPTKWGLNSKQTMMKRWQPCQNQLGRFHKTSQDGSPAEAARPAPRTSQASLASRSSFGGHVVRTFKPHRLAIGT
jgi:hypothetical protein